TAGDSSEHSTAAADSSTKPAPPRGSPSSANPAAPSPTATPPYPSSTPASHNPRKATRMSDQPDQQPARAFSDFLREHSNGVADMDLADALKECVSAVARLGESAKLTYSITVSPTKGDQLSVADTLAVKLP